MTCGGEVINKNFAVNTIPLPGLAFDGVLVQPAKPRMFLYHKPPGVIVSRKDPRFSVFDDLKEIGCHILTVGRLDFLSEGLMLIATHGEITQAWELSDVTRSYEVITRATSIDRHMLESEMIVDGIKYKPGVVKSVVALGLDLWSVEIELTEGKNREIRNIWAACGLQIKRLIRHSYGPYRLSDLKGRKFKEIPVEVPAGL